MVIFGRDVNNTLRTIVDTNNNISATFIFPRSYINKVNRKIVVKKW